MNKRNERLKMAWKRAFFVVLSAAFAMAIADASSLWANEKASAMKSGKACKTAQTKSAHAHGVHSKSKHKHGIPGKSASYIKKIIKMADAIGIDEKQKSKIGDLYVAASGKAAAIKAEIDVTVSSFMSLHKKGDMSEKAIESYANKMGELKTRLLNTNLQATYDAKQILTPAQREKLRELRMSWKKKCGKKHG